jgi:hypothetical protein
MSECVNPYKERQPLYGCSNSTVCVKFICSIDVERNFNESNVNIIKVLKGYEHLNPMHLLSLKNLEKIVNKEQLNLCLFNDTMQVLNTTQRYNQMLYNPLLL